VSVQRPILEAFDRVLLREAHNLTRWPELLWQQLYNELQFERESVVATLAPELARRTAVGAPPWLWRRTPLGQSGALLATLPGHDHGWINYCAISPEGSYVVAGFADGTLKLWDPATGAELQTFGSRFGVWGCAVAPDGSYVVASTEDRKLKLWDPAAGTLLRTLGGDETPLIGCAVSPDGSFVASGGFDGILRLWDPTTGEELGRVGARGSLVTVQAVAPDASYIVAAGEDAPLRLWDPSSGALLQAFGGESAGQHCAVAPDGSYVVSAGGQTLRLLDPASGEERRTLAAGPFTDCAVSPDGAFVVSTSMDSTVRLWDPASGEEVATLTGHGTGHGSEAMCCAVSPDGSYLVSGGKDRTLRVWARPTGQTVGAGGGALRGMVGACAVSPDG
jgi:WD40 repeat protein